MCALRCCPVDTPPALPDFIPAGDTMYMVGPQMSKAAILLISDIFGMHRASKQLADTLARAGFLVLMPDFFGDGAWSHEKYPIDYASAEWKAFHARISNVDHFRPRAERALALLRAMGCTHIGAMGMCWGSLLSFDLAARACVDAAGTAHPAFFSAAKVEAAQTPVCVLPSINEADFDAVATAVQSHAHQPSVYKKYDKLTHGFFGARLDRAKLDDEAKAQLDDAFAITIDFFTRTLHKSD